MAEPGHGQRPGAPVLGGRILTQQLSSSGYILDARPPQDQPAAPRPPAAPPELPPAPAGRLTVPAGQPAAAIPRPRPAVLLLSRSCDAELAAVGDLLTRVGVRWARINADELATVHLQVDLDRRAVRLNDDWLAPTVAWVRHFSGRAIAGRGGHAQDVFLRDSWHTTAGQLSALAWVSIQPQRPGALDQLLLAQRLGITVPKTVVTTDPSQALGILTGGRLVVKAIGQHFVEADPGRLNGVFAALAERDRLAEWDCAAPMAQPGPPVIVQEYVPHEAELRIYYVHGQLHGFEVSKEIPADLWLSPDRVGARRVDVPGQVAAATQRLASALSLRYGAFDFLLRDGEPVFLELNPDGDWRWLELKAGCSPVTLATAQMLCDAHRQVCPAAGTGSFGLLAFLSAAPRAR